MSEHQYRPATPEVVSAPPALATQQAASGFGIGSNELNEGIRTLPDGGSAYGSDPAASGWFGGIVKQVDRAMAKAELSSKFNVVEDDFVGPRIGNQLTRSEFEKVATLYSDIRMGDSNIKFDTTGMDDGGAADFRSKSMEDIGTILTTSQGRDLVDQLAYQQVSGVDNTTTIGRSATPGAAGTVAGPGGSFANGANGIGTNTLVTYQPGVDFDMSKALSPNYETSKYKDITPDTVLFHELVHANHMRQGLADTNSIDRSEATHKNDRGVVAEEYATVGLAGYGDELNENAYRKERAWITGTAIPQRDTYNGSGPAKKKTKAKKKKT